MARVQNGDNVEVHVWPSERIKRNPRGATTKSPKDTKPALTARLRPVSTDTVPTA